MPRAERSALSVPPAETPVPGDGATRGAWMLVAQSEVEGKALWCDVPMCSWGRNRDMDVGRDRDRDMDRLPSEVAARECCSMLAELPPTGASTSAPVLHQYICASTRCQEWIFEQ